MKKRLGNFLLLCGLICLVLFFTSNAFILDEAIFLFGGVSLSSLGLLLKRGSRRKKKRRRKKRRDRDQQDQEGVYD
jgi:Kef-type K+ transport system membrane component KefB